MKNEDTNIAQIVQFGDRFSIMNKGEEVGSYSRRRDAVRSAERKGFVVA